jgi:hypothetical protein
LFGPVNICLTFWFFDDIFFSDVTNLLLYVFFLLSHQYIILLYIKNMNMFKFREGKNNHINKIQKKNGLEHVNEDVEQISISL